MNKYYLFFIILILSLQSRGDTLPNPYRLVILESNKDYQKAIQMDVDQTMIDLSGIKGIIFDLKYATANNFMRKKLYPPITTTYLKKPAAEALIKVQASLKKMNLGIKIWDAYRPYQTTVDMWKPIMDEKYVANPAKGSGHNRGIAVDITLINLSTGLELDMGTGFDDFSAKAGHTYTALPSSVLDNRKLLRTMMEQFAFKALESEWWHYYFPGDQFTLMNYSFKQLRQLTIHPNAQ